MTTKYRVLAVEEDGTELPFQVELDLTSANVSYTTTSSESVKDKLDAASGDHHAGYECIPAGEEITIDANKQSRILCEVKMQGSLVITGHLIID